MAAFDFPPTPAVGTLYPAVAEVGKPQYRWNGSEWTAATLDPAGYVRKSGDAMTGALSLAGDPTQALHAVPKQYLDAQRTRISLAGGKSFDVQVPAGANTVRMNGIIFPSSTAIVDLAIQVSVSAGVFRTTSGDYVFSGFRHHSITTNTTVEPSNVASYIGMLVAAAHSSDGLGLQFEGTLVLKRPNTTRAFQGDFRSITSGINGMTHQFFQGVLQVAAAGSALNILAFRLMSGGDNWAAESYLTVEWL